MTDKINLTSIKRFRIFSAENDRFYYNVYPIDTYHALTREDCWFEYDNQYKIIYGIVEAYTGLNDKNDESIFENDVVLMYGRRYIVKYDNINFSYIFSGIDLKEKYWFSINKGKECEIIGNIHERITYDEQENNPL